jgi:outer membrane beta-barrel protein
MVANPSHAAPLRTWACAALLLALSASAAAAQEPGAPIDSLATDAAAESLAAPAAAPSAPARPVMNAPLKVGTRRVRLVGASRNVVRSGPGDGFAVVGVYPAKTEFKVIAKSGDWNGVRISDTETGWVHRSLCKEFDDMSDLEFKPNPRLYSRTGSFLIEGYTGGYAFDQKSNSLVAGGRLGYYVFDRLTVEGGLSWTHVHRPAEIVESLFGLSLEAEDFHMLFYHFLATYELLPGRQMVPYVSAGVGSSIMRGESSPSLNFGGGTNVYLSKRTAVRWEVRDYRFKTNGAKGSQHTNHNIELTLGSMYLF